MEVLTLIKTKDELYSLIKYVEAQEFVAIDTETTGTDKSAQVIGISLCADEELGFYVVLRAWEKDKLEEKETLEHIGSLLLSLTIKKLVMHNAVFDCFMIKNNFGIDLMSSVHTDTMILSHLLDETRSNGLKDLGISLFGEDATEEKNAMQESVKANGGFLTKNKYELYKADVDLIGRYGAKDALLTYKLFIHLVPELFEQNLDGFFYKEESMPLLRGPTYELNTTGLKVDLDKLIQLRASLEGECLELKSSIYKEIEEAIKDDYPGHSKNTIFNIESGKQIAWLLFIKLKNPFCSLTKEGLNVCKALGISTPYSNKQKRDFIILCADNKDKAYGKNKKIRDPWHYIASDKSAVAEFSKRYRWATMLLEYSKKKKLLNTYVIGLQDRLRYGVIRPQFFQHGTTSGRYSSSNPNFQNLPRDDKRIKGCIIARENKVFVGADYSQLEPRIFASYSQDKPLLACFESGQDFYSVIGAEVFDKKDVSLIKDDENSFAKKHPELRTISKVIALSITYGTTASKLSKALACKTEEAQDIIDRYLEKFPGVAALMEHSHEEVKKRGVVYNKYGRPRRVPLAKDIEKIFGTTPHEKIPYNYRKFLNLSVNHKIQSTAASIVNRASIAFYNAAKEAGLGDCRFVLQVHDEIVVECQEKDALKVSIYLKDAMETACNLDGVALIAEPKIGKTLAELK